MLVRLTLPPTWLAPVLGRSVTAWLTLPPTWGKLLVHAAPAPTWVRVRVRVRVRGRGRVKSEE